MLNHRSILLFVLSFCLSAALFAQDSESIKITHGPYLCDMTQDAVTVVWTTNKPALSWVELAYDGNDSFYAKEHPRYYEVLNGRRQARRTLHKVRLNNLTAGKSYRYRVFSKEVLHWESHNNIIYGKTVATNVYNKKPLVFKTFRNQADNISFVVLNDIHGRADFMKKLCAQVDFKALDFVMQNGDMANSIESEEQIFTDFIDASVSLFASETPFMYCRGNHETRGKYADFLPEYLPTEDNKFYHFYTIGNTAFLVLDCGEDKPDSDIEYSGISEFDRYREIQAQWLAKVIESDEFKKAEKKVVFLHIPPMVGSWHGTQHLMQLFVPLLNKAKVDVMFSGHTHKYSYHPANEKVHFPTIVNGNNTYLKCDISSKGINIEIIGEDGEVKHKHNLNK